jgi:hypothetical protein
MLPCLRDGGCSSREKETFGETQFVIVRHLGKDVFDLLCSTFIFRRFMFDFSTFYVGRNYVRRFMFDVLCSTFYVRRFMFDVLFSTFYFGS